MVALLAAWEFVRFFCSLLLGHATFKRYIEKNIGFRAYPKIRHLKEIVL